MTDEVLRAKARESVLELVRGDIVEQDVDAIVNAANEFLAGGGGVDGAIHAAAGYAELRAELQLLGGCAVGDAKLTKGYRLKARYIVHAVGPRFGMRGCAGLLASAHRRALEVAADAGARSVAFPAISTGVFGYPLYEAAPIALGAALDFLDHDDRVRLVRFVLFSDEQLRVFARILGELRPS